MVTATILGTVDNTASVVFLKMDSHRYLVCTGLFVSEREQLVFPFLDIKLLVVFVVDAVDI